MFNNSQALETKLENHVNQIQMLAATTSKMLGLIVSEKRLKKKKQTLLTGTPFFMRILGFMMVVS